MKSVNPAIQGPRCRACKCSLDGMAESGSCPGCGASYPPLLSTGISAEAKRFAWTLGWPVIGAAAIFPAMVLVAMLSLFIGQITVFEFCVLPLCLLTLLNSSVVLLFWLARAVGPVEYRRRQKLCHSTKDRWLCGTVVVLALMASAIGMLWLVRLMR